MPLLCEIIPAAGIRAGIWKITESADEFLTGIQLGPAETDLFSAFRNDLRKRHWLACRAILKYLLSPLPAQIIYDANGKPFLESGSHPISVSHSGDFAAAVYSQDMAVGIDIEKMRDRVDRVKERFLHKEELAALSPVNQHEQLHVYWGGKEALYKLHGLPGVDLRDDIRVSPFDYLCREEQQIGATIRVDGVVFEHQLFYKEVEGYMVVVAF